MANSIFKHFQTVFYSEAFSGDGGDWSVFPSKRWAVFCINDAEISDNERMQITHTNEFRGTHWFTVALWM